MPLTPPLLEKIHALQPSMREKAKRLKRTLPLVTHHPIDTFQRVNYFQELLAHTPEQLRGKAELTSTYRSTIYFKPPEATTYRVIINSDKRICLYQQLLCQQATQNPKIPVLFSTTPEKKYMLVLTVDGELFSAPKENNLQHSSFNRGGYLLFAGYWEVTNGRITKIIAESGHYEPPLTSLQNLARILHYAGYKIDDITWIYVKRQITPQKQGITREEIAIDVKDLLGPPIERPKDPTILAQRDPALVYCSFFNTIKSSILTSPTRNSGPAPAAGNSSSAPATQVPSSC